MKKLKLLALAGILSFTMFSCSDDDTTAPVVVLNGDASVEASLNSGTYSDPGATASDDEDGEVTVTSDYNSTSNPNTNLVGTYTITYSATDAAGNVGVAVRTVRVKNDAEAYAGSFAVHDSLAPSVVFDYNITIAVDEDENNRVNFGDGMFFYANNNTVHATMQGNGNLTIPLQQTPNNIGTDNGGSCDVASHSFSSTNFTGNTDQFTLQYIDKNECNQASSTGYATFTRQ